MKRRETRALFSPSIVIAGGLAEVLPLMHLPRETMTV